MANEPTRESSTAPTLAAAGVELRPRGQERSAALPIRREDPGTSHRVADAEERRSVRRAMALGAFLWPAFLLCDVYLCLVVYPGAPLLRFVAYRVLGELAIVAVYLASLRKDITSRGLKAANALACGFCSVLVSLMALDLGGLASPYIHGISLIIFAVALAVPAPWRDALRYAGPSALSLPAVIAIEALFDPTVRAMVADTQQLSELGGHYANVVASVAIAAAGGQAAWNARRQLRNARRLGRYRLEARIGAGGMNEVWLAWDESLRRNVALKILRSNADADPRVVARFEREAHALSRLTSANTVRVFDFGASEDGVSFIAMEYLPGADLQQIVRESGPMPVERAIALVRQACRSLAEAHAAGIVHRDVKPANLFVTHSGDQHDLLKVLDFGIARLIADATRTQTVAGTPAYMAPECWIGADPDVRSDVYAVGATLHFLVTGRAPFEDVVASELVRAHMLRAPEPPSACRPEVPATLDAIVLRCLEKSPTERFAKIEELEAALDACARELPRAWTNEDAAAFWAARERESADEPLSVVASSGPLARA